MMPGLGVYIDVACACMDHLSSQRHTAPQSSVATARHARLTSALAVTPPAAKAFPRSPTMVRMRSDAYRHVLTCFGPFLCVQPLSTCPLAPSLCVRGVCPLPRHMRPPCRMPALPLCQSDSCIASPHAMPAPTRHQPPPMQPAHPSPFKLGVVPSMATIDLFRSAKGDDNSGHLH